MKISDSKYIGINGMSTTVLEKVKKNPPRKFNESYFGPINERNNGGFIGRRPFHKKRSIRKSNQSSKIQELPRITEVSEVNSLSKLVCPRNQLIFLKSYLYNKSRLSIGSDSQVKKTFLLNEHLAVII